MADKGERLLLNRLDSLDPNHAECRFGRHKWDRDDFEYVTVDNQTYVHVPWNCLQCLSARRDFYTKSGEFVYRHYVYADGYVFKYTNDERDMGVRLTTRNIGKALVKQAVASGEVKNAKKNGKK